MRTRNKLNVRQIAGLTEPNVYSDGGGLYLRIRPSGTRSWVFVRVVNGRRREFGLGSAMDVPLARAREKASALRTAFLENRDAPFAVRPGASSSEAPTTFGAYASEFISSIEGGFRNEKHRKQWHSTIETYAAPLLNRPIAEVSVADIVAVLKDIWLEKPETARRVRGRIERILAAAKVSGLRSGDNPAALKGHLELLLPKQARKDERHHAALPFAALPDFMAKLRDRKGSAARALEFTTLTAARSGEVFGMTWAEVDWDAKLWTIPADRMKAGQAHQVPLSDAALSVLKPLRPADPVAAAKVFNNDKGSSLSNMAMTAVLRRMGHGDITVHGFRSTFRDWVGEKTEFAREDAEMALAHVIGSKAERAYRRGKSVEKRRALMTAWSGFIGT